MKIQLIGHYGGDITHACSAWTSTNRELTEEKRNRIPQLLRMLASEGHHTPFEKSSLHFLVTTDIATHIHLLKHRIAVSINAESARYKEINDDQYYIPDDWPLEWQERLINHTLQGLKLYHQAVDELIAGGMDKKRAKESARFFRTYNTEIDSDIMFNWRSFYHFLNLRNNIKAQKEVHLVANTMLNLVKNIDDQPFKYTIEAFNLS